MKKSTKPTTQTSRTAGPTSKAKTTAEKKTTTNAKKTTTNAKETTAKEPTAKKATTVAKKATAKKATAKKATAKKKTSAKKTTTATAARAAPKRAAPEETTPVSVAPPTEAPATEAPATEPLPPSPPSEPPLSQANTVVAGRAVHEEIRQLEAELDRMIDEASRRDVSTLLGDDDDDAPRPRPSGPIVEPRRPAEPASEPTVFETARELLTTDFYLRKWGRLAMRNRSEEVDDFGHDPTYEARVRPLLDFLYHTYFRVECTGIEHVPAAGRCLLVANHSGTVPLDGLMLRTAIRREQETARDLRWLSEDFIYHFPFVGSIVNRLGAVRACPENAERLLGKEALVAVFPEGVKGIGKLFRERYRLQRFGRGGFIRLCLRTSTPIVPVAIVGAEETHPLLFRIEHLVKAVGLPYVPVTPTFPLLGPLGLVPAPTKWRIAFGEPLDLRGYGPEAADDELLVSRLAERVRATIQGMLDRTLGERKSVFFG